MVYEKELIFKRIRCYGWVGIFYEVLVGVKSIGY